MGMETRDVSKSNGRYVFMCNNNMFNFGGNIWWIIILIVLFGGCNGGSGCGCSNGCGCENNGCGYPSSNGCGCGICG